MDTSTTTTTTTTETLSLDTCAFCEGSYPAVVKFVKVYDKWLVSWWLEPIHPLSGSDHLATWCQSCGPKHRSERGYDDWKLRALDYLTQ